MQALRMTGFILLIIFMGNQGTALADIPPPPPEIPGTQMTLPRPVSTAVGGVLLSIAVTLAGLQWARRKNERSRKVAGLLGVLCVAGTLGLTMLSIISYQSYQESRANWRSNGPFERFDPSASSNMNEAAETIEPSVP